MSPLNICEPVIVAIVYNDDGKVATQLLQSIVELIKFKGIKIGGLINQVDDNAYDGSIIYSIGDHRKYNIFQNLGEGSTCCKLNPEALAQASIVLQEAIDDSVAVLAINKFGVAESEGRGFINEFCNAISNQILVISTVHSKYLSDWRNFTGELGKEFFTDKQPIVEWLQKKLKYNE